MPEGTGRSVPDRRHRDIIGTVRTKNGAVAHIHPSRTVTGNSLGLSKGKKSVLIGLVLFGGVACSVLVGGRGQRVFQKF